MKLFLSEFKVRGGGLWDIDTAPRQDCRGVQIIIHAAVTVCQAAGPQLVEGPSLLCEGEPGVSVL